MLTKLSLLEGNVCLLFLELEYWRQRYEGNLMLAVIALGRLR